jgi:hypothetical protein
MKRTRAGFGWRTVSYRLRVSHNVSSIIGEPPFQFAASLVKLPGERDDCPP